MESSFTGPLTKYLVKAIDDNEFVITNTNYYIDNDEEVYLIQFGKQYDGKPVSYFLGLRENKYERLAKDRHEMFLVMICYMDTTEECKRFLKDIEYLQIPGEVVSINNKLLLPISVTFKREIKIKNIRNFSKELYEAEQYFVDSGIIEGYLDFKYHKKGNEA